MEFRPTAIPDVVLVIPRVYQDERGFFLETYHESKYREGGVDARFVQDNHSRSRRGTLRGLHAQLATPQGKLVRAIEGEIWDVAVDARPGSPTLGRWVAERLSAENFRQLWIPEGFLHGFCVLSDAAQVEYKCTAFYSPRDEISVRWDDSEIGIEWPLEDPVLSRRDQKAQSFAEMLELLDLS